MISEFPLRKPGSFGLTELADHLSDLQRQGTIGDYKILDVLADLPKGRLRVWFSSEEEAVSAKASWQEETSH